MTDTQQAIVKCFPADNNVRIELVLAGKQRFMSRPKTEPLERTLNRIQIAAAPVPGAVANMHEFLAVSHGIILSASMCSILSMHGTACHGVSIC